MKKCHFIVLIIFSICWAACKNSNNNPVAPINFQNKGPLIPLDVGNIWVYVDSVTTTTYGSLDTVSSLHVSFDSVAILNKWIFGKDTLYIPTYSVNFIFVFCCLTPQSIVLVSRACRRKLVCYRPAPPSFEII